VSVYFTALDRVRPFADYLYKSFNKSADNGIIEVDINKVKEKENFNFLSKVTNSISILLLMFSIVATALFILNLLRSHLAKVRMNIGTFKAIGLADREATGIYITIIFRFIALATAAGLVAALITGSIADMVLTNTQAVEQDISYFKLLDKTTLLDVRTFVALAVIVGVSFYTSQATIKRMLNKTPGNLIYNR
jgi:hypothetical protein